MNLPPEILRQQLSDCIKANELLSGFCVSAIQIARGWIAKNRTDLDPFQVDEVIAGLSRRLMRNWQKINPDGNVFSYITGMTRYAIMDHERKWKRNEARTVALEDFHLGDEKSLQVHRAKQNQF